MKKFMLYTLLVVTLGFCIVVFRPIPISPEKDCLTEEGIVSQIFEGGTKDIVFKLRNSDMTFYINRGLEQGLELESLRAKLLHNQVTIKYPDYWTPLDPVGSSKHIVKLYYQDEVIFNELGS